MKGKEIGDSRLVISDLKWKKEKRSARAEMRFQVEERIGDSRSQREGTEKGSAIADLRFQISD